MRYIYKILFLFLFLNFSCVLNAKNNNSVTNLALPSATISGTTTVCQNASQPQITFTGSGGTAPYTFVYRIGTGVNINIISTGNNATVNVPTTTSGTYTYTLLSVQDAITPANTSSGTATVTINPSPDAAMGGTGSGSIFNGVPVFKICSNTISSFTFTNTTSTSSLNSDYTISWGDGSPDFNSTSWSTTAHTYAIGLWNLIYTIKGTNGCNTTKSYIVFVGSNPAVSLGNPGNTDICNSSSLTFPITGTTNNPPGTTYTVTFNDGSTPEVFNHPPPSSVTHTFLKSSCGITSSDGSNSYPNSFFANIVATNPCNTSSVGVVPIYVSTAPIANFTLPATACSNAPVCFTNSTTGANEINSGSCNTSAKITWSISPSTGYSISSGSLGNDFNSSDPSLWQTGSNTLCLIFSQAGTYTITIKTGNRCGLDTKVKTICIEPPLNPSFTLNSNSGCSPQTITASNATVPTNTCTPATYLWSVTHTPDFCGTTIAQIPNQTTTNATYNFTEPGTYTIKLTASNSCTPAQVTTKIVTVKKPPTVTINTITNVCQTSSSTSINPTALVPTCANATYAWSFPGGTPATSTLAVPGPIAYTTSGTFTVSLSVTNECGTTIAADKTFTINPTPSITGDLSSCVGFTSQLTGTTTAASTLPWTSSNSTVATINSTGLVTGVSGGTTTITYTNSNNCKTTALFTVIPAPTITQPSSSTVCLGGNPTPLSISVSGATGTPTYQWYSNLSNNTTSGTAIPNETNTTFNPPASTVGTIYYYCSITLPSGACSSIKSNAATVTINAGAIINTHPTITQSLCEGVTISTPLSVSYTGGTGTVSYQWYSNTSNTNAGGILISGATNANYTPSIFTLNGNYYYYVSLSFSGNGCGPILSNPAEVIVYPDPTLSSQPIPTQSLCQNATPTILEVVANGGNGTFSYQWYSNPNTSFIGSTLIAGATNSTYTPLTNAVGKKYYYCIVKQPTAGCSVTSSNAEVIIINAPTLSSEPISSTVCIGGTPTLLSVSVSGANGTPQYQWYSNSSNSTIGSTLINGATSATYSPPKTIVGTIYYFCIINLASGGCSILTSTIASVTINPIPIISNKNNLICSGNTFTILPDNLSGDTVPLGTTYTWANPTISPSGTITGASAQSTPQTSISQTLVNTTTNPATVTYIVTPKTGVCIGSNFTIEVTVNPGISVLKTIKNSICYGNNNGSIVTTINGGIPFGSGTPYLISWTGPNGYTAITSNISNLAPGNYTLSVADAGGCPFNDTYTINEPSDIIITTDLEKNVSCYNAANGEIKISISGGTLNYTYAWTKNGIPFANTEDLSNLSPGFYQVSVSDANTCGPKTASFTITEPPLLTVTLDSKTNLLCYGQPTGAINVNVVGGTLPYTYSWTGPNGFTSSNPNLTNVLSGIYNLIVTDYSSCTKTLNLTLSQQPEIIIKATTTPISCYGANDASISIALSGGVAPYAIQWSNLGGSTFQNNLSAGDYLITVTDANNCTKTLNVNIPEAPVFTIDPVVKNISCFGDKNGSINLNIVGGIAPVKVVWSDSVVAGTVRNNLGPGSYSVTISDAKPCTFVRSFIILEPQLVVLSANLTDALDCDNANSGAINLLVAGGSPPFTYIWSNGATTKDLINIPAGNYLVTAKDANGCSKQAQYSINRPTPIVTNVTTKTDYNCDTKTVKQTFVAQVSGGVPPYQLIWSSGTVSGSNNEFMNTSQNGTVLLKATDAIGCKSSYSFNVNLQFLGTPSFDSSSFAFSTYGNYSINDPIQFTNTATGDYISMYWDFGDGSVSTDLNPTHTFINPKEYVVTQTVTYPFGCVYVNKISFVVGKGYVLVVPNAFTPNNDTLNDTFRPVTKALKNVRLEIYDTWGSMIYSETGDILRGWDGKIKNSNAENGNYYCKVSGETFYGTIVNVNHPFVLIK